MKKQIKKSLSILMVFCAMMAIFCVPASAASNMHEGTYNGVYFQTRASINSDYGMANIDYGVSSRLSIKATVKTKSSSGTSNIPYSARRSGTSLGCIFQRESTSITLISASCISYIAGTKVDTISVAP